MTSLTSPIRLVAFLVLVGLGSAPVLCHAGPEKKSKPISKAKLAELTENAFGSIWIDSDLEDIDVEADVRDALNAGVSPNVRDRYGDTLLLQAVENNRTSVVRILLKRGANPNLATIKEGETPLIRACNSSDSWSLGINLAAPTVRLLLSYNAKPNIRSKGGDSAILAAAMNGNSEVVALLLKAGADFKLGNKQGLTPLSVASRTTPDEKAKVNTMFLWPNASLSNDPKQAPKEMAEGQKAEREGEQRLKAGLAKCRQLLIRAGAKK